MTVFTLSNSLKSFAKGSLRFRIISSLPSSDAKPLSLTSTPPKTLYVLDSSFNPPTRAHLRICTSALLQGTPSVTPKRLLLLLSTQNADKAPKPAVFEQRLAMMEIFAQEVIDAVKNPYPDYLRRGLQDGEVVVDVGVTKDALFMDKARKLEECWDYTLLNGHGTRTPMEQVHLIGFDTMIRLLDIKYYPPDHNLKPLEGLFEKHRLRVTRRTDDAWGGKEAQDEYLSNLRDGDREDEGAKREWADKVELVDGRREGEETVSSTKVREAVRKRDEYELRKLVTSGVAKWILDEKLYLKDE